MCMHGEGVHLHALIIKLEMLMFALKDNTGLGKHAIVTVSPSFTYQCAPVSTEFLDKINVNAHTSNTQRSVVLPLFKLGAGRCKLNALWLNQYNKGILTNYIVNGWFSEARGESCDASITQTGIVLQCYGKEIQLSQSEINYTCDHVLQIHLFGLKYQV